ncbi:MAG: DEAD/DEAH box helicase family protein [Nocardioidaceae bacterium]
MAAGHGRADYLLYVDQKVVGVIEAKPEGTPLSGVEWQSAMYADGLPADVRLAALTKDGRLPFVFEASPAPRPTSPTASTLTRGPAGSSTSPSRRPSPRPCATQGRAEHPTWRGKVHRHARAGHQAPAAGADRGDQRRRAAACAEQRFDRSLVQMATGAGKTYTAVTLSYRLLKFGGFDRILFLVDRNNLADQTLAEFENYRTPDDGRRFTELYNVDRAQPAPGWPGRPSVAISTIQRVFKALRNEEVADADDPSLDGYVPDTPVDGRLQRRHPAGDVRPDHRRRGPPLDLRPVARRAGVLRRPRRRPHRDPGQADLRVLQAEPRLRVHLPAVGGRQRQRRLRHLPDQDPDQRAGHRPSRPAPSSRRSTGAPAPSAYEALDEDLDYTSGQLDRAVTATDQIRTVLETFRDRLFTEIFPGRTTVPKTLIFAKDDNHAEEIVTPGARGVRQGQRLRRQDHLQRPQRRAAARRRSARQPGAADRRHRRHDRHRHRREAAGVRVLHARRPLRAVLRADEGPRRPHHRVSRLPGGHPDADDEDPLRASSTPSGSPSTTSSSRRSTARSRSASRSCWTRPPACTITEDETATLASRLADAGTRARPRGARRARRASPAVRCATSSARLVDAVDPDRASRSHRRCRGPGRSRVSS